MNKSLKYGLLTFVFVVLLFIAVLAALMGEEHKTFFSFLNMLQSVPEVIPMDAIYDYFNFNSAGWIENIPDGLNWFAGFLSFLNSLTTFLGFIIKGLIDTAVFVFYCVRWIFI